MSSADLIRRHGFAVVLVVLLVGLSIALLRVVALPLAGVAVLLDGAANKAATSQFLTDLADEGGTR
ncbi:hypothetical protein [Nocardiopsis sp. NRRL B-16309]|uniref:hypothetical protein n=1 Tax=Nocardiopsis sp. NRRL B-16309 TaxID=1519494 RepID=UPI0006AF9255|nr:hypothetical protein [Nocardiopsis sp. NRRL B-16309]KOX10229.1 hypothetical protein ADL05_26575 [Nocardiopsis sp. NRRL B-16309]